MIWSPCVYNKTVFVDILAFAYFAQCRCNPAKTIEYFSAFTEIVDTMKNRGVAPPEALDMILAEERSRHRFTWQDVEKAKVQLGFGKDNVLGVDLEDADDDFIIRAWRDAMKRVWREADGSSLRVELIDAFKVIADLRGSVKLRDTWENGKGSMMTLDTAYSTLQVSKEFDESTLLAVYAMRVRPIS
jgi:ubiquitin carboxyl-terminal hydrolase 25